MAQQIVLTSPEGWQRNAGFVNREKNAFIVHKDFEKHFFRNYSGIGFNQKLIQGLIDEKVGRVWVFLKKGDETKLLKTTPETIKEFGVDYRNPQDFKDNQYILSLKHFEGDIFEP